MEFAIIAAVALILIRVIFKGLRILDVVDIVFIGFETFVFSFLALRPYDNFFFGYKLLDPGEEKIFLNGYQTVIQKFSNFTQVHNHTRQQSLFIAIAITAAVVVALILVEFIAAARFSILALVKYGVGAFASWLFTENMRFLGGASEQTRITAFSILLAVHIIIFLIWDLTYLKSYSASLTRDVQERTRVKKATKRAKKAEEKAKEKQRRELNKAIDKRYKEEQKEGEGTDYDPTVWLRKL